MTPNVAATALIWSGALNGTWDTTTANWLNAGASATFQNGNAVIFDDSASANTTINLSANRTPGTVVVNNTTKNYNISGSAIAGTGCLIKQGGGTLTLGSANSYSGGTTNSGGTITIGNANALGTGTLTMNGGLLDNSATLTLANNIVISGSGSAIQCDSANNFSINGVISGNGSLTLGNGGVNMSVYPGGVNVMTGGTIIFANNANAVRFASASFGNTNVAFVFNNPNANKDTFDFGAGTISFGSLTGSGVLGGNSSGLHTISAGALGWNDVFSGTLVDQAGQVALTKVGAGTLTLTGANTYTGGTIVNAGELVISTISAAKGNYTVANGATLGVTNVTSGSALASNLTVFAGSTLEFQNVTSATTPLIAASNVTLNGSCTVKITGTNGLVAGGIIRSLNTPARSAAASQTCNCRCPTAGAAR